MAINRIPHIEALADLLAIIPKRKQAIVREAFAAKTPVRITSSGYGVWLVFPNSVRVETKLFNGMTTAPLAVPPIYHFWKNHAPAIMATQQDEEFFLAFLGAERKKVVDRAFDLATPVAG